ncbi:MULTISPECIES: type II toxin-antitoxin system RelE/ParE family toxin [Rhodomicrobium]|uniref:type II toxin-antitoxin system RelE/ParE family toxin n=1 Tax=Rhodomicrobium TaxID=1068 RepID=UPI000B4B0EB1|nr:MULTISPECIES: type II toxin-antitoxin system RelE/ParE family toxin [Rhodomicrobium]
MKLVWLPRAVADLQEVRAYIAERDARTARAVAQKVRTLVARLKVHPGMGRPTEIDDIRKISVPGLPYLIPYRVRDDRIEILRVFHTAQDQPGSWHE